MDLCEPKQSLRRHKAPESFIPRPTLVLAERNDATATTTTTTTTRRPRTREVGSRYKSPSPASPCVPRRCPSASPNVRRTVSAPSQSSSKRAQSVERKWSSTPPSPPSPKLSTPVHDTSVDLQLSRRTSGGSRLAESLWPSTMRSLSVSFQSDSISIPVSKKEKPVSTTLSDRALKPSSNVAASHKQVETPTVICKSTPERKMSPSRGKIFKPDQLENSKPVDGIHSRMIDQNRWPGRIGGKVNSNGSNNSSLGPTDRTVRTSSKPPMGNSLTSPRSRTVGFDPNSVDNNSMQAYASHKLVSTSSTDSLLLSVIPGSRSRSRPPSPSRTSVFSSPVSKGVSPVRTMPSTPTSRGNSPSRIRPSSNCAQPSGSGSTSVLRFIVDLKKGKKVEAYIEDAYQLRLLYNRYMQWRFSNAQAEAVLHMQKAKAERTLCNVWNHTRNIWDSVIRKRIDLQQLKLELKLISVLNDQMVYLDKWDALERDHISSLSGALEDLEANTVRIPVTIGARADIESLKGAICSAVDVMQAIRSSICSLVSNAEAVNSLVYGLAVTVAQEKAMLDECEPLFSSTSAMQAEEYSLRTHITQVKQALQNELSGLASNQSTSLIW